MSKRKVQGVGINDANYVVCKTINGKRVFCGIYERWKGIFTRCYSIKFQERQPTYIGCTVDPRWHKFSNFRDWIIQQDWEGKEVDKDLLIPGNKVYGPDTCIMVSKTVNLLMHSHENERGEWPIGVYYEKCSGRFKAQCSDPFIGKNINLGRFDTPEEAHTAWLTYKVNLINRTMQEEDDTIIKQALFNNLINLVRGI